MDKFIEQKVKYIKKFKTVSERETLSSVNKYSFPLLKKIIAPTIKKYLL
jgi:hypothetical protein